MKDHQDHPRANHQGYVYEYRLAAESAMGRILKETEIVHHVNGDPTDNRSENLCVITRREHGDAEAETRFKKGVIRGVSFNKNSGKWRARVWIGGRETSLGLFSSRDEAVVAMIAKRKDMYGI
jgi:hypothetical protein